jgi:hypothetical protein
MLAPTSDDVSKEFTSAARVEKAVGRLHHPPPDGFATLLGNFGSSISSLHFGGKTAMTRPFQGYAQYGLFNWTFVLESRHRLDIKRFIHDAARWFGAEGGDRAGNVASGQLSSSTCISSQASRRSSRNPS